MPGSHPVKGQRSSPSANIFEGQLPRGCSGLIPGYTTYIALLPEHKSDTPGTATPASGCFSKFKPANFNREKSALDLGDLLGSAKVRSTEASEGDQHDVLGPRLQGTPKLSEIAGNHHRLLGMGATYDKSISADR